ncbi:MAG: DedA family protein [Reinekea sp.]|jgi:undecaprenyl-diphosphatase|nr:DedA family protein [Reinekea sp.]
MAWLSESPYLVLSAILLISFLESFALLGILVPGVVLLFSLAAIASNIGIHPVTLMAFGAVGASAGDLLSFLIGHKLQGKITHWRWFKHHQSWLEQGEWFIKRWGWLSVIIGRFLGPLRPVIPVVAGTLGMPSRLFIPLNLFTVLFWAPAYLLPGYFTGELSELWQLQPLSTRELTIYVLTAVSLCASALAIYHHAHPERWHLKGWISRHQADRWPFTSLTMTALSTITLILLLLFPPNVQNQQFLEWSVTWQSEWINPLWVALRNLSDPAFMTLIFATLMLWCTAHFRFGFVIAATGAYLGLGLTGLITERWLGIAEQYQHFIGLLYFAFTTAFISNLLASQLHSLRRWPIYLIASQILVIGTLSHIWEGSLSLSDVGIGLSIALLFSSLLRALWQILHLWAKPNAIAVTILLTLASAAFALL